MSLEPLIPEININFGLNFTLLKLLNYLFNINSLQQSRLPWIDFAKGVAIVFVVYRHILIGLNRSGFYFEPFYSTIAEVGLTFRMHLFFVIAGIFLRKSLQKRTNPNFVIDKLKSLIYPYLVWTVLQITLQIVMGKYTNASRSLVDYLYIITNPRAIDQFWFIYALFNVSILYLVFFRATNGYKWMLSLIAIGIYILAPFIKISVLDDIFTYFPFLIIGDIFSGFLLNKENKIYFNFLSLLALTTIFSLGIFFYFYYSLNYFLLTILALLGSALTINLAFIISNTILGKIFRVFGYHSLYLFLMHSMVGATVRILLVKVFAIEIPEFLLFACTLSGCIFPIVVYNFLAKTNFWFLFTPENPHQNKPLSTALSKV